MLDLEAIDAVLEEQGEEAVVGVSRQPDRPVVVVRVSSARRVVVADEDLEAGPRSRRSAMRPTWSPRLSEMAAVSSSSRPLVRAAYSAATPRRLSGLAGQWSSGCANIFT